MYLILSGLQRNSTVLAVAGDEGEANALLAFWYKRGYVSAEIVRTVSI